MSTGWNIIRHGTSGQGGSGNNSNMIVNVIMPYVLFHDLLCIEMNIANDLFFPKLTIFFKVLYRLALYFHCLFIQTHDANADTYGTELRQEKIEGGIVSNTNEYNLLFEKVEMRSNAYSIFDLKFENNTKIYSTHYLAFSHLNNSQFQKEMSEYFNNKMEITYQYQSAQIKLSSRCIVKVTSDYVKKTFTSCANILDFLRFSVRFDNVNDLSNGLNKLISDIKKGNVIKCLLPNDMLRIKDGFNDILLKTVKVDDNKNENTHKRAMNNILIAYIRNIKRNRSNTKLSDNTAMTCKTGDVVGNRLHIAALILEEITYNVCMKRVAKDLKTSLTNKLASFSTAKDKGVTFKNNEPVCKCIIINVFNLVKHILTIGVLEIPGGIGTVGLISALVLTTISSITHLTAIVLENKIFKWIYTFDKHFARLMGCLGDSISIALELFGIILTHNTYKCFHSSMNDVLYSKDFVQTILVFFILYPLTSLPKIHSLAISSLIVFIAMFHTIRLFRYDFFDLKNTTIEGRGNGNESLINRSVVWVNFYSPIDKENGNCFRFWLESFGMFAASFNCHFNISDIDFYGELNNFRFTISIAFTVVIFIHTFIDLTPHLAFGNNASQNCLDSRLILFFQIKHRVHYTSFLKEEIIADILASSLVKINVHDIDDSNNNTNNNINTNTNFQSTSMASMVYMASDVCLSLSPQVVIVDGVDEEKKDGNNNRMRIGDGELERATSGTSGTRERTTINQMAVIEDNKHSNVFTISFVYLVITFGVWTISIEPSNIIASFLSLMILLHCILFWFCLF